MATGNASAIRAGRAYVELFADDSKLVRGLRNAKSYLKAWGASVASVGAKVFTVGSAIVASFVPAIAIFAQMGDALDKASARTGASVESLSSLGYAAGQSGSNLEDLEKGLRKMQQTTVEAAGGAETAVAALSALGVTAAELDGLSPDEQFRKFADGIAKIEDPAKRTAAAMDIFGKSGADLLPLMSGGADGIRELEDRAKALGLVMSSEDAASAAALGDAWDDLLSVGKSLAKTIGAALGPELTRITKAIVETSSGAIRWLDQNREMIVVAAKFGAAIAGVGAALVAVGGGLAAGGVVVGGFAAAITGVIAAVKLAVGAFLALVSPVGLAIAAVVGLTAAAVYFSGVGSLIVERLQSIGQMIKTAFGGIVAEISNGDFAGAWNIAMNAAGIEIQKGMLAAKRYVYEAVQEIRETITGLAKISLPGKLGAMLSKGINKGAGGLIDKAAGGNRAEVTKGFDAEEAAISAAMKSLETMISAAKRESESRFQALPKPPTVGQLDLAMPNSGPNQKSAGTFNSVGAGRLGGSGAIFNRIAKAAEETAKNTADIKRKRGVEFQ